MIANLVASDDARCDSIIMAAASSCEGTQQRKRPLAPARVSKAEVILSGDLVRVRWTLNPEEAPPEQLRIELHVRDAEDDECGEHVAMSVVMATCVGEAMLVLPGDADLEDAATAAARQPRRFRTTTVRLRVTVEDFGASGGPVEAGAPWHRALQVLPADAEG